MSARAAIATALAAALAALAPAAASADLGPIKLVSKTVPEQAASATAPALSADGRYLAFRGTLDEGRTGVFRVDLQTGEIARVASGEPNEPSSPGATSSAPSISADGRYVSFTTRAALDPADDTAPNSSDVYVADMSTRPPTYELASALDGSTQAMSGASAASPRVALSGDGRKVVFVNGGQVYLRDLDADTTTLVSVARDPLTGAMEPGQPVPGGAVFPSFSGAALSADGTTVAWVGAHLPAQVPLLADERAAIESADAATAPPAGYNEPLWRRVADGPLAPTRRMVGGGDPLAPGCPADGTLSDPACQGPFPVLTTKNGTINSALGWLGTTSGGTTSIDGVPQLSADGRWAAVIGNPTEATNVFLVDMSPGLTRRQAVRQLTAQVAVKPSDEGSVVNVEPYVPLNGHVFDLAISGDGEKVAFVTARQKFPLAPPNLVGTPPAQLGLVEVYVYDREDESLRRVTHGLGGEAEPSEAVGLRAVNGEGATAPTLDRDGGLIGFASVASNLVSGDGNSASDVFTVTDASASPAGDTSISEPVPQSVPPARRRFLVSARSLRSGAVELVVVPPADGSLRASAAAALGGPRQRSLGGGRVRVRADRPVRLILSPPRRYRPLVHSREGIYATARVAFDPTSGRTLHREIEVRFHASSGERRARR